MKTQKLLVIVAIVCLLVGASSAAMARNDCPDGYLVGGTFEEIKIDEENVSCEILGVNVTGSVVVKGAGHITIKGSLINGNLRVIGAANAFIVDNQVEGNKLVSKNNTISTVLRNVVRSGSIKVVDSRCDQTDQVEVIQNLVFGGSLSVECTQRAAVIENNVKDGSIECSDNETLISRDNYAESLSCSAF